MQPASIDDYKDPREKLLELERAISSRVFEREEEIRGFLIGLIARAHVLFLGPKGAAKSALARLLCDAVAWSGVPEGQDPYFRAQLARDSVLDELFGPVSAKGYEEDTFRRNTAGMLPEAKVGLLEEIYKSNPTVLSRLLTLLNEGVFKNGTEPERAVPLRLVVGTSNELPDGRDDNLDAFHDRFMLRYEVSYLKDRASQRKMMERANSNERRAPLSPIVTEEEIEQAAEQARGVDVSPVFDAIDDILVALADREIVPSDRRRAALVPLVKAQAYLEGRTSAVRGDLAVLSHALWEDPDHITEVTRIVLKEANPHAAHAHRLFDAAHDSYTAAMKAHRAAKAHGDAETPEAEKAREDETTAGMNAITALKNAARRLFELKEAAKDSGADPAAISKLLQKTTAMNEEVTQKCIGI
ncbi:AAA domain-containing protein (plasmid) [Rubrobacter marinus]|uniref:AAA domain-containing protein n=1 Tax=Rubrobacter marinus TaxID=2653852 RepID=A0A6G8Q3Q3_9ACTN|nr:AAA family ATPase [Rubrobacter marinus]QIN81078.1 AAA domain-containing protein [Rubrobacter marinus]